MAVDRSITRAAPSRLVDAARTSALGASLVLAGLMLLAFVIRTWLNRRVDAPWIMGDELIYSEMAKSFASGDGFDVREVASSTRTLYPALISPAWLSDSVGTAFATAKVINTAAMTLAAVPLYLWARRLVSEGWALAAAGLLLLMPAFAYTGTIMTENAFLPVFLFALFAFARMLEAPTWPRQLLAVALAGAAVTIRLQGLILLAVLVSAIVLDAVLAARGGQPRLRAFALRLRSFAPTAILLLLLVLAYLGYALVSSGHVSGGLGGYRSVVQPEYSLSDGLRWTVLHAGELGLSVGLLPVSAFVLLAGAWSRREAIPAERAFVCVTAAALLWIVPQAGFFASRYSERIEERNMFYLEPLLLLALVAWVARGAPRPPRATAVAVAIPAALLAAIPLERLFTVALLSDTFALIPFLRLSTMVDGGTDAVRVLLVLGALAAALLFVLVPRRLAWATIGATAVFLALSAWSVAGALRDQANATRMETQTDNADWIDDAVGSGAEVPFIFTADLAPNPHLLWQTEFWNRTVGEIYGLDSADPTTLPVVPTTVDPRGRIVEAGSRRPLSPRYVVAQPSLAIEGTEVASQGRLVLYRVPAPLRLGSRVEGLFTDGWSGEKGSYVGYPDQPGTIRVNVGRTGWGGPDVPGRVLIEVKRLDSGRLVSSTRWVVHSLAKRTFRLRTPAAPFRVDVSVDPTFSPSAFGHGDQRQLGAQLGFAFEPSAPTGG